ncbi:KATNB1-like protein 1 isoform X1 [Syngnathus typhle]|uniref:KATNB1-like protein 1 isoform X1 n=1 Tax=Syngnathus typhle TaxID=161592 RepID=UPI002A69FFB1|nr:KATNB1-like protein 1 isoform X1 [Syngnathus typhle]XP_061125630.1 KATNB1-like protein 1 isoform X1 [Syngnathus typhle]
MKQVDIRNKDQLDKERLLVHSPGTEKRPSFRKRKSSLSLEVGVKLHRKTSNVGRARDTGMANKENEVTCSDLRGNRYRDNCRPTVNAAGASKMAGPASKYSDFTELSKDHEAVSHILFGRNLRLRVALTLWRRNASELVAYLIVIQDRGVLLDLLPVITNNLQSEASCFSIGCCVDLIPQVKVILSGKYEEHIIVGLHWVQAVIRKWWPDLSKPEKILRDSLDNRNIVVLKQRLRDLWKDGARLCLVSGSTGDLAKAVEAYVLQLP